MFGAHSAVGGLSTLPGWVFNEFIPVGGKAWAFDSQDND